MISPEYQTLGRPIQSQFWNLDCPKTDAEAFDLSNFDLDAFPSLTPFWPDPLLRSPVSVSQNIYGAGDWPNLTFDEFDRTRLLYDMRSLPPELQGELPASHNLTAILRQYFQYVDPFCPFIHVPSFSIKSCSTPALIMLLATGDIYSQRRTVDVWAHDAFRYLLHFDLEKFENGEAELPTFTIQSLILSVSVMAFSVDAKKMLLASHQRVTMAHICHRLLELDEEERSFHQIEEETEVGWLNWIRRETRRRILQVAHVIETSVSMYYGEPSMLRISELNIPLPESEDLWCAESHERWLHIRRTMGFQEEEQPHFRHVLANLIYDDGHMIERYNDLAGRHALAVGIQDTASLGRYIGKLDNRAEGTSAYMLAKSREGLDAWKASWHSRGRAANRPQYVAIMSAWFSTELSLNAPDVILRMVYRVSTSTDMQHLMTSFVTDIDQTSGLLDGEMLNNLMNAVSAFLLHVECILGFLSLEACVKALDETVFPDVVSSIFLGALSCWYSLRMHAQIGPAAYNELLARLNAVVANIPWLAHTSQDEISIVILLGNVLMQTKVWGTHREGRG
jgi:hypothetical protein